MKKLVQIRLEFVSLSRKTLILLCTNKKQKFRFFSLEMKKAIVKKSEYPLTTEDQLLPVISSSSYEKDVSLSYDCTNSDYGDFFVKLNKEDCCCLLCFKEHGVFTHLKYYPGNIRSHVKVSHPGVFFDDRSWLEMCTSIKSKFPKKVFRGTKRKKRKASAVIKEEKIKRKTLLDPTARSEKNPFKWLKKDKEAVESAVVIGLQLMEAEKEKNEFKDPVEFWMKQLKRLPVLQKLSSYSLRLLCLQLSSAFSESIFSYGGNTSSGNQARCGPLRLNARMFVRFNLEIMEAEFDERINEFKDPKKRANFSEAVKKLFAKVNDESILEEDFTIEDDGSL